MIKRISSTLIMVLAIVLSCPAFAFSTFASTDNDQVEYMVSVLPNSDKFGSYRTDGRFFDSATYPEHNVVPWQSGRLFGPHSCTVSFLCYSALHPHTMFLWLIMAILLWMLPTIMSPSRHI